jgi:hypothetical protein
MCLYVSVYLCPAHPTEKPVVTEDQSCISNVPKALTYPIQFNCCHNTVLCEDYKKGTTAINAKLRIALVRRASLQKVGEMAQRGAQPDWEAVSQFHGGLPPPALNFFKKRWLTLVHMYDQVIEMETQPAKYSKQRRLLGAVDLTFAVQGLPRRDRGTTFAVIPKTKDRKNGFSDPQRLPGRAHEEDSDTDGEGNGDDDTDSESDVTVSSGPGEATSMLANSVAALKMQLGSWVSGSPASFPRRR